MKMVYKVKSQIPELAELVKEPKGQSGTDTGNSALAQVGDLETKVKNQEKKIGRLNTVIQTVLLLFAISIAISIFGNFIQLTLSYTSELRQLQDNRYQLQQKNIDFIDQKYSGLLTTPTIPNFPTIKQ